MEELLVASTLVRALSATPGKVGASGSGCVGAQASEAANLRGDLSRSSSFRGDMSCSLEAPLLGDASAEQVDIAHALSAVVEYAAAAAAIVMSGERDANALSDEHVESMGAAEGLALAEAVESTGLSTRKMLLSGV